MQEVEHTDRNGRPRLSQSNFRVPSSRSAYGSTPGWVEKATKDFLDDAGDTEPSFGIKQLPYTRPQLRETIKRRIMAGSNGGRPGQWSARKAQLVAQAYRRAGGGYRGKPGRTQRSLKKWTSERWTTSDGKPARRKGRMTRYLPAAAWKRLTPSQRRATIAKKLAGDKAGKQFVANTQRAANASKKTRSKTLGPSVDEVAKNPNAPKVFSDTSSEKDRIVSTEPLEQAFSPNKEKLNQITNAPSYGENPPVKPFVHGNIDIDNRQPIEKQNGDFSLIEPTIIDGSDDEAGMFIIVPLITKFGQLVEITNASSYFSKTDEHLGKFKSREDAEKYLDWLKDIEEEISYRDKKKPIISMHPIEKIAESAGDGFESRRMSIKNTIKRITDKYMTEKALGPTLSAVNSVQIYDPDAIDADGDGLVQDATPWMRPSLPSSPIIAGLRSMGKSNIASQRAVKEAQEFIKFVSQHEPELTQMMRDLADKKGSSFYLRGLKNRQKPVESLALKAQRLQNLFDGDLTDSITSMNDPLRYTFESDDVNKYTNDVLGVISALAKKGHNASVTNYWTSGDPYKGINVMVDHPDGFFYEIQFHTPSSYRLKNKLTPLYEKYRDEKNVKKRQEIYDEMLKLSKGVSIPKEIGKFGEPLSRGSGQADFKPARPGKLIPTPLGMRSIRERIPMKEILPSTQNFDTEIDVFSTSGTRREKLKEDLLVWADLNEELEKRFLTMDEWTDDQKERIKKQIVDLSDNLRAMRDDWQSMGRRERSGLPRRERIIDGFESHPEIDMTIDDIIKQAELRIHDDGTLSLRLPANPVLRRLIPGERDYHNTEIPDKKAVQSMLDKAKAKGGYRPYNELRESKFKLNPMGVDEPRYVLFSDDDWYPFYELFSDNYIDFLSKERSGPGAVLKIRANEIAAKILKHYIMPELDKLPRNERAKIGKLQTDNKFFIHGYLQLLADPHSWPDLHKRMEREGFMVPPIVAFHDIFGHFALGNTFDRHGEWGNILASISFARDKAFWNKLREIPGLEDLTEEDRDIFIRVNLMEVASPWFGRVASGDDTPNEIIRIAEIIKNYDGPIDELIDMLDPPNKQSQGGMSSTRRTPLTNVTDGQLVNLGLQSVDGVAIREEMFKSSGMSSRRRDMTESEKERLRPITLAPDEKVKLQPGTTLVYTDEDDRIIRTELIGPQVARVRGMAGMKLYTDPSPDNQDAVDAQMREWEELYGPVSSPQRQAKGRGSQPDRTAREQGRPRTTNEDPIDRILRETEEARGRRGLSS